MTKVERPMPSFNNAAPERCDPGFYKEPATGICESCVTLCDNSPAQCIESCPGYVRQSVADHTSGTDFRFSYERQTILFHATITLSILCILLIVIAVIIFIFRRRKRPQKEHDRSSEPAMDSCTLPSKESEKSEHSALIYLTDEIDLSREKIELSNHSTNSGEHSVSCRRIRTSALVSNHPSYTELTTGHTIRLFRSSALPTEHFTTSRVFLLADGTNLSVDLLSEDYFSEGLDDSDAPGITIRYNGGIEKLRDRRHEIDEGAVIHVTMFDAGIDVFFEPDHPGTDLNKVKDQIVTITGLLPREVRVRTDPVPERKRLK